MNVVLTALILNIYRKSNGMAARRSSRNQPLI